MKIIPTLTGLRGLAASMVFVSHAANELLIPRVFGQGFGQIGVMIFFVLSGFLMGHLYAGEDWNRANVRRYALARIGRVFPLYFLVLGLSIIISNLVFPDFLWSFHELSSNLLALALVTAPYVFWTIPVEVQFYCVFVGFWFLRSRGFGFLALSCFALITTIPAVVLVFMFGSVPFVFSSYALPFFAGVGTAFLYERARTSESMNRAADLAGFPFLVLLFVNLPELRYQYGLVLSDDFFLRTWGDPVTWVIVYGVFFCALLNSKSLAFLNWRPFAFLGVVSYGFYLLHYPILVYVAKIRWSSTLPLWSSTLTLASAFALTSLASHLSFKYFERPLGTRIRHL